jgi:hypothetical protein
MGYVEGQNAAIRVHERRRPGRDRSSGQPEPAGGSNRVECTALEIRETASSSVPSRSIASVFAD